MGQNENLPPIKNLSYLNSEEPDELSQANALNAIDKLLSLEEISDYSTPFQENCSGKFAPNSNSGPNLSTSVAKYLSKFNKSENSSLVRTLDVFEWARSPDEQDREKEKEENYVSYEVGPMTQMAAEAIQELFNASPISPIKENNNSTKREREKDNEREFEFTVFKHPKRRRSIVERRNAVNRLPLIMDKVKRKKRSPVFRRNRGNIGNIEDIKEVKFREKEKKSRVLRERSEVTHLNERRRERSMSGIRVLFSQNLDPNIVKQQKKILSRFRVMVVSSIQDATHFVADRFARTKNMLEAIARGRHVVTRDWLESCSENHCFVNEEKFVLRDIKKEREIGFCLLDSIKIALKHPLLEGWRVLVTQKIQPDKELIKCLVKASNGQLVERISRYTIENEENLQGNFFIITCTEDYKICSPLLKIGIKAYDAELLLNGIVIQKLEFKRHRLFVKNS